VSGCVLDTDVVIAALDRRDAHHRDAVKGLTTLIDGGIGLLLSLVNYAETLVKPAEDERTLRDAVDAVEALGIELVAPTPAIARNAARYRGLGVSLADGFAMATAHAHGASVASFDSRVGGALSEAGLEPAEALG